MLRHVSLLAALMAGLVLSACSRPEPAVPPIRAVKLIKVGEGRLASQQEYAADIRARTESRLGFQVSGKLQQRLVEVGQAVRAGQLLAVLDPQDYQVNAQAAVAQLQAAQSQRDLAQADLRRFETLRNQGFISNAELERHQVTLKNAEAAVKQAQAGASVQGNQAAYTRLQADADGVIVGVDAEPGQVLAAGSPVLRLARQGPRDAVFVVPEDRVRSVKLGDTVQVRLWARDGTTAPVLKGQVREIAASADPVTRTFVVKASVNSDAVKLGTTATVILGGAAAIERASDAMLQVPMTAIWQSGKDSAVWVFDAEHSVVKARVVQLGHVDGNHATLTGGVQAGEEIVVVGTHVLTEGQSVSRFQSTSTPGGQQP